jgi:hypothetical protein
MAPIQLTIDRENAEALLPLIEEQIEAQAGTASGALWRALHTAVVAALQGR